MTFNPTELSNIKEQAALWLVKMDSAQLNAEELSDFEAWINTSDFHLTYFNKMAKNWESLSALTPLADAYPIDSFKKAGSGSKNTNGWERFLARPALAGYAMAILLSVTIILKWDVTKTQTYQTAAGEHASYTLDDGSMIALNTNTQITVRYSKHRRIVNLEHGEANFEVAKNKERPFIVEAGGGLVWAVGTVFDVRSINNSVDVVVSEGTIKVYSDISANSHSVALNVPVVSSSTEAIVTAGNGIQYQKIVGKIIPLTEKARMIRLAWINGSLIFDGETLEKAIEEISRYTNTKIIISDSDIKSMRIGGHYKIKDIDALLFTLGKSFNIKVSKDEQGKIILSKQ